MTVKVSYEEKRRQRMEENKKRIEELKLHNLALSLKPSPRVINKPKNVEKNVNTAPTRRSTRTADKTPPTYKYKRTFVNTLVKGSSYSIRQNNLFYRVSISEEDKMYTANKAKELASSLGSQFPTFAKPLTISPIFGRCLSLPPTFCKTHFADHNQVFTVIDEENQEWQFNYLVRNSEFIGGWQTFSSAHELIVGDALVFQLIKPNTLKVYIIRVNKVISCF